ncbi:complement component C8 alpha chain [Synchiropus splendidus]|uniref:complement component C8 alpha chain n=1 Tax=Synchiropus splendidus TaxID=270530 RepID=UPI00237DF804|nr:complement component C8 alpha chain [Synchiropus splendidus]
MNMRTSGPGIAFYILILSSTPHLISGINVSWRQPATPDHSRVAAARRVRDVNRPAPINCRLGSWSPWTACDSCTDKKFRFRHMERPSQFGGSVCYETLWETLGCPAATTQCLVPDYCGQSFTCRETGRCISKTLRCNGEPDCDDFSDEDNCESFNQRRDKCSSLLSIPGAEQGTQGYNALTGEFVDRVIDPLYFGGRCEYVYNGEWRKFVYDAFCENLHYNEDEKNYRKPYNYHSYRFVAEASSEGSQEYFQDMVSLLKARKTMRSSNIGVSFGIYYVQVGLSMSKEMEFLRNVSQYRSQELGFIRLLSKVHTAHFKIRSDQLMLHEDFYMSLMELPEQYDFGMYSNFLNTFGTHYVTEGIMGGALEYVVVVNKTSLAESKIEMKLAGRCLGASLGLSYSSGNYERLELSVGGKVCKTSGTNTEADDSGSAEIQDIITLVKGGNLVSSGGLLAIRNVETYRKWGASIKYNPALVEYETLPIYELVRRSTAADHVGARLSNLERAWEEYMGHFHPCRCAPCRHNGIPVLTGTSCSCICQPGYMGHACEETRRSDTRTDGSWSCWGAWSTCASGKKRRSRNCNNPAPDGGGANCLGSSSQTKGC